MISQHLGVDVTDLEERYRQRLEEVAAGEIEVDQERRGRGSGRTGTRTTQR